MPASAKQSTFSYAVAITTLVLFVSWPYIFVSMVLLSFFSKAVLACVVIITSTLLLPAQLLWDGLTRSYVLTTWLEFFNFSWTVEEPFSSYKSKSVIFCEFPHGAFPFGPILAAGPCAVLFPGHDVFGLAASAVFYVPGYKHFMRWIGALPASRQNLTQLLRKGSVAVTMGGIAEMFMVREDREEILLRNRRGLMRVAIETGAAVVPVYHLGNSRVLAFGPAFFKILSRRLRTAIGITVGRWGLPIPHQHPINMVVGSAIPPEKLVKAPGEEGYEEEMREACERLIEKLATELEALYKRHRGAIPGWDKRPLIIH